MADSPQSPTPDDPGDEIPFPPLARVRANVPPGPPTRTTRSSASSNPRPKKKRKFSASSFRSLLRRSLRHVGLGSKKEGLQAPTATSPPSEEEEEEEEDTIIPPSPSPSDSTRPPRPSSNDSGRPPSPSSPSSHPSSTFGHPLHRCPKRLPKPRYLPFLPPDRRGYASYITTHWLPYLRSRLSNLSRSDRIQFLSYFLDEKCTSVCAAAQSEHWLKQEKDYVWLVHRDAVLAWWYENPWAVEERTREVRGAGRGGWRDAERERRGWVEGWGALREGQRALFAGWGGEGGGFGEAGVWEFGPSGVGFWEVGPRGEGVEGEEV